MNIYIYMVVYLGSVKNHTSFHRKRSSMSRWVDEVRKHCLQICWAFLAHCEGFRLSRVNQTELQPAMDCSEAMTRVANNAEHGLWDPTDEARFFWKFTENPSAESDLVQPNQCWMHQIAINIPIINYHPVAASSTMMCWPIRMALGSQAWYLMLGIAGDFRCVSHLRSPSSCGPLWVWFLSLL